MIKKANNAPCLFGNLPGMPDQSHLLYQLADKIDWGKIETAFQPLYYQDNGRPGKPIRLICGLPILKHLRNLQMSLWLDNRAKTLVISIPGACRRNVTCPINAKLHKKIVKKVLGIVKR